MTNPTIYDAIPYPGYPFPQSHPDRLATLGILLGLTVPEISTCRVLEIGCGDGLNLIPMALGLPAANFLGIDLVADGINKGNRIIDQLGLKNITLREMDILEISQDLGQFDYIIVHGIYSWVPENVRDKLLSVCRENLTQCGIAYISYNALPGAHMRSMVRDMMRYHIDQFDTLTQKLTQARVMLEFITESASITNDAYFAVLQQERNRIRAFSDHSLYHDDLIEFSTPVYFSAFIEHAGHYKLQYLTEANFYESHLGISPPDALNVINQISSSVIAKEQYLDFIKGRRFRQTLLCRAELKLDHNPLTEKIVNLYISSPMRPESQDCKPNEPGNVNFIGPNDLTLPIDNPLIKAAFMQLATNWPKSIHFNKLLDDALSVCNVKHDKDEASKALSDMLLALYSGDLVELHIQPSQFVLHPSEYPISSPLARLQIIEDSNVTNLKHSIAIIDDPIGRKLLPLLDGSRDRDRLASELSEWIISEKVSIPQIDVKTASNEQIRLVAAEQLDLCLNKFAYSALLLA